MTGHGRGGYTRDFVSMSGVNELHAPNAMDMKLDSKCIEMNESSAWSCHNWYEIC